MPGRGLLFGFLALVGMVGLTEAAQPPAQPTTPTTPASPPPKPLGWLSQQYEVGSGGPGTVSTGNGDAGGASYGSYQMTSQYVDKNKVVHVGGTVQSFVNQNYATEFKGLTPGTADFTKKWKELAKNDPTGFGQTQHDYIKSTHYDATVNGVKSNLDVANRSSALQNVVWSTSVQHGATGGKNIIETALAKQIKDGTVDKMSDEDIIKAIYAERGRTNPDGSLAHFGGNSKSVQKGVADRFVSEQARALSALADEQKAAAAAKKPAPTPTPVSDANGEGHFRVFVDGKPQSNVAPAEYGKALEKYTKLFKGKSVALRGPYFSVKAIRQTADKVKTVITSVIGMIPGLPPGVSQAATSLVDAYLDSQIPAAALAYGDKVTPEFRKKAREVAAALGVPADDLMTVMALETGGKFLPTKYASSGAVGLIQFTKIAADDLGTTKDDLAKLSAVDQLDWVQKYLELQAKRHGKLTDVNDLYCAIFCPAAVGKDGSYVAYDKSVSPTAYDNNKSLDANNDGKITKDEITARVKQWYKDGQSAWVDVGQIGR